MNKKIRKEKTRLNLWEIANYEKIRLIQARALILPVLLYYRLV